jgi:putative ABC transport system permease protein
MNPGRRIARHLRRLFHRRDAEAEMAEEMRFHLEHRAADYAASGLPEAEARNAAQRKFGNLGSIQERARDVYAYERAERLVKDLRFGLRQLTRSPGYTLLAVVTLGLGIGANTSMFSLLNALMLRPLPYADSGQLDAIYRISSPNTINPLDGGIAPADFLDLRREKSGYSDIAGFAYADMSLSEPGQPAEMPRAIRVTPNLFSVLRTRPQLGRDFRADEGVPGNDRVLIISDHYWRAHFGGREDVVGRFVRVSGEPHEIIGVLPPSFDDWRHLGWVEVFRPLGLDQRKSADRRDTMLRLIGRRSGDLSPPETETFIANFGARLAADFPEADAGSSWHRVSLNESFLGKGGAAVLTMLIGLSGFVLLIACSNLANLLLARTIARAREFAVRSALGASRIQLLRPLLAESLLLAAAGGICAVAVTVLVDGYLNQRSMSEAGDTANLTVNWLVLGWALSVSLATALVFGLSPAVFAMRLDLNETLKSGARGATGGRGHRRYRSALIVSQFAFAMVLLAGAALLIRGVDDLNHRRSGWESEHLVTGTIVLPATTYPGPDRITAFHRLAVERLEALPGVTSASVSSFTPFFNWYDARRFVVEGRQLPERGKEPSAVVNSVSPRYFETVGTRVVAGRIFNERDTSASPRVFVINQVMATGLFGRDNPVGHRLAQAGGDTLQWGEIVGVVADVTSVVPDRSPVTYQLYQAMAQEPRARSEIAVRTSGAPSSALMNDVRASMTGLDQDLPVRKLMPADISINRANYQMGIIRDALSSFALLGLGLATLGIYGVISRTTAQRTSEFAIRIALGANMREITRIVLVSGVKLALFGSVLGLLGAYGVSRILAAGFPGMQLDNRPGVIATTLLLIAVAMVACWLPARRAARVDAITALRSE